MPQIIPTFPSSFQVPLSSELRYHKAEPKASAERADDESQTKTLALLRCQRSERAREETGEARTQGREKGTGEREERREVQGVEGNRGEVGWVTFPRVE